LVILADVNIIECEGSQYPPAGKALDIIKQYFTGTAFIRILTEQTLMVQVY